MFTFVVAMAIQLDKNTLGYLTYNAGLQSSMSTVVERNTEKYHCNLTITLGIPHCYIAAAYTRKLLEQGLKLRVALKCVLLCDDVWCDIATF